MISLFNSVVFAVFGGGSYVRCLSVGAGDLVWEANVDDSVTSSVAQMTISDGWLQIFFKFLDERIDIIISLKIA